MIRLGGVVVVVVGRGVVVVVVVGVSSFLFVEEL